MSKRKRDNGDGGGGRGWKRPKSSEAWRDQVVLGRALRELREARGLTQQAVAERTEKLATFVGRLERGERGARWHSVRTILRAMEASAEELGAAIERHDRATPPPAR